MNTASLKNLEFELACLSLLTREGFKPLSRWEKEYDRTTERQLQTLGLKTRVVERSVQSGRRLRELLFSTSDSFLAAYAARFDHTAIQPTAANMRLEGLLFGYPSCCVESFIARGYARNVLRRADQRVLFHWACPRCAITPLLLPHYRRVFQQCRRGRRGQAVRTLSSSITPLFTGRLRAVAALAASLTLGAVATQTALAAPDPHWLSLPTWEDPDADLLKSLEEEILGKDPSKPDENGNQQPDGADLAWALSLALEALPTTPSSVQPYVEHVMAFGLESCQVCGAVTNMGFMKIVNPLENQSAEVPYIARHFLEHGSFNYSGTEHSGRLNAPLLNNVLTSIGLGHFLHEPAAGDSDDDGLRNWEESAFQCEPALRDTDGDQLIDCIDTARALRTQLEALPRAGSPEQGPKDRPFVVEHPMDGTETCPRCGESVVMDIWDVINPVTKMSLSVPSMALHYLKHGGCLWRGGQLMGGQGRVDPLQLKAILTGQGGGHLLPVTPDADGDLLKDTEERDLGTSPQVADEDANQVADGIDLARKTAGEIAVLPTGPVIAPVFRLDFPLRGLERCDICGTNVNMGHLTVCNPLAQLYAKVPYIELHYLEHGSFSFAGDVHGKDRADVRLLVDALHSAGPSHLVPVTGDTDGDGLKDLEEPSFQLDKNLADTDGDGVPDGFALARGMWKEIASLPTSPNGGVYLTAYEANCFAPCPVCGENLNCGHVVITNRQTELSLQISYLNLHFLEQGSFAVSASERVDPLQLEAVLRPGVVIAAEGTQVTLRWQTRAGHQYQLFTASQLLGPWTAGPVFQGNGTEQEFAEDRPTGASCRFYKIVVTATSGN